jgi:hypothetical protein
MWYKCMKNELPKKMLWTNHGGQRGRGQPKSRWIDGVQEDAKAACSRTLLQRNSYLTDVRDVTLSETALTKKKSSTRRCKLWKEVGGVLHW